MVDLPHPIFLIKKLIKIVEGKLYSWGDTYYCCQFKKMEEGKIFSYPEKIPTSTFFDCLDEFYNSSSNSTISWKNSKSPSPIKRLENKQTSFIKSDFEIKLRYVTCEENFSLIVCKIKKKITLINNLL